MPAIRGDLVYAANLITNLAAAGASVTVLALSQMDADDPPKKEAKSFLASGVRWHILPRRRLRRIWSLASNLPGDAFRTATPEYRAALVQALRQDRWDAVIINHICMGWAIEPLRRWMASRVTPPPIIYVSHNHEMSLKPQAAAAQRVNPLYKAILKHDAEKLVRLDREMIEASALMTTITDEDQALYRRDFPSTPMLTLLPGYDGTIVKQRVIGEQTPRKCIMFGSIVWIAKKQNLVDFLRCADPIFTQAGISVEIVGNVEPEFANQVSRWAKCCRFVGRVDEVAAYFENARVGIMPDRVGGGFKHKHLQYVFNRVPLITMAGQNSGLPLSEGSDVLVASSPEEMSRLVVETIDDFPRLNAMQEAAFQKCRGKFEWSVRGVQFLEALRELTGVKGDEPEKSDEPERVAQPFW